jgi:hypothetical protein
LAWGLPRPPGAKPAKRAHHLDGGICAAPPIVR